MFNPPGRVQNISKLGMLLYYIAIDCKNVPNKVLGECIEQPVSSGEPNLWSLHQSYRIMEIS